MDMAQSYMLFVQRAPYSSNMWRWLRTEGSLGFRPVPHDSIRSEASALSFDPEPAYPGCPFVFDNLHDEECFIYLPSLILLRKAYHSPVWSVLGQWITVDGILQIYTVLHALFLSCMAQDRALSRIC